MKKIHQKPIHFGIATSAVSYKDKALSEIGKKLFTSINYTGVGSAEFKYDERDEKLKLIEINSRYWQQNALADFCGMNFPLIDYLEATGQDPNPIEDFVEGYKYVSLYTDYKSYKEYKKNGEMTFSQWKRDIKGKRIVSFFYKDDLTVLGIFMLRMALKKAVQIRNKFRKVK